jgi:ribosomal protein L5
MLETIAIFDNLTSLIIKSLVEYGGLNEMEIAKKLICFGINEVIIFQGVKSNVRI